MNEDVEDDEDDEMEKSARFPSTLTI